MMRTRPLMAEPYHGHGDGSVTSTWPPRNDDWYSPKIADLRDTTRRVLTGKQRRHLRALAHGLRPIVQIGKDGIDAGLVKAADQALADHELIKVKVAEGAGLDRHEAADELAAQTHSEVAQVLGNIVLLYRPDPEEPQIKLPRHAGECRARISSTRTTIRR